MSADMDTERGPAPGAAGAEGESCLFEGGLEPCGFVIFGASGDLTARKLIPALYKLSVSGGLPVCYWILGVARTAMDDAAFRDKMRAAVPGADPARWEAFARCLHYHTVEYDDPPSYQALAARLTDLDREHECGGNRIFNLAVPPALYAVIAGQLGRAGLADESGGWSRLVVEKPFGRDLASARELDRALSRHFAEHQVFRIDHYLAKETVQNTIMFRFANSIFEPVWNRNYIASVTIVAGETLGVGHRAGYYESAGVLRDMFQNHMMQLLALVAMEPASRFAAENVRDEKTKVFRALRPFPVERIEQSLVLGQYTAGTLDGRAVAGYREDPGVDPGSLTPTFALLRCYIDNWRWQGVPFFLVSGKRLKRKVTRMIIQFKEVPHSLFRRVLGESISANRLVLGVQPDETITLSFQAKAAGARVCLRPVQMAFDYHDPAGGPKLDAYEKALLDCMLGDQILFWRQDGLEQTWSYLDPVLNECESCRDRAGRLHRYPAGSWGPEAAGTLLPGWPEPAL